MMFILKLCHFYVAEIPWMRKIFLFFYKIFLQHVKVSPLSHDRITFLILMKKKRIKF